MSEGLPAGHVTAVPLAENPYSALSLYPPGERQAGAAMPAPAARLPWWLNPLAWLAVGLILLYRNVLPDGWKRHCIYTPTCSLYGLRSIQKYGLVRGVARTWARIRRCNGVLYLGGVDAP